MLFTLYKFFRFATFAKSYAYKFIVPEVRFHADTIRASPAVIARKTTQVIQIFILANSTRPHYNP